MSDTARTLTPEERASLSKFGARLEYLGGIAGSAVNEADLQQLAKEFQASDISDLEELLVRGRESHVDEEPSVLGAGVGGSVGDAGIIPINRTASGDPIFAEGTEKAPAAEAGAVDRRAPVDDQPLALVEADQRGELPDADRRQENNGAGEAGGQHVL